MRRDCNERTTLNIDIPPTVITACEAQPVSLIWTINLNKTPERYVFASETIEVRDDDCNDIRYMKSQVDIFELDSR